ncbi:transposase (plasmid) [Borreliella andersonii]|uniref:Transposase n=1 Tax=Borrelia andersonii TaxID=42109 RepID=A0ABZ3JCZ5_BORAD
MTYSLYKRTRDEFNYDKDHIHLLIKFIPKIQTSKFTNNLKLKLLYAPFSTEEAYILDAQKAYSESK